MKAIVAALVVAVLASVGGAVYVGRRFAEPTVVPDPYEAGLRYDHDGHAHDAAAVGPRIAPACALSRAPCTRTVGRVRVTLDVEPRPVRAMTELVFTVDVSPSRAAGGQGRIALAMPGMYMGENRVLLSPAGEGRWRGRGVLVRCPSGSHTWTADVELPAAAPDEPAVAAAFRFEVAE